MSGDRGNAETYPSQTLSIMGIFVIVRWETGYEMYDSYPLPQ